jgi:tRNA pseudouridine55 synthase
MAQEKEYTGTFTLGATTPTYDLESEPENLRPVEAITEEMINSATKKFIGEIFQVPPIHSAIKIGGTRVYELARQGKEVKLEPRKITIKEFVITKIEMPIVHFKVVCTTGTYIRSLAYDFGEALGCGAHLSSLCRTRIGEFTIADAMSMEAFEKKVNESL